MKNLLPIFSLLNDSVLGSFYIDFPYVNTFYDKIFSYILISIIFGLILTVVFKVIPNLKSINYKEFLFSNSTISIRGFTLIELLVVISIIAILAVIGMALFSGTQAKARNTKRRADIDAIAKTLEVNKVQTGYILLASTQFAGQSIPAADPQTYPYCANSTASNQPVDPSSRWNRGPSGCTPLGASWGAVGTTNPPAGTSWKVCAWLEAEGATLATAYCKVSIQ